MTEGQFQRAVQINSRITDLTKTLGHIKDTTKNRLWYAFNNGGICSDWRLTAEYVMKPIADILDKHDNMIRREIEGEIERLKEEIKSL